MHAVEDSVRALRRALREEGNLETSLGLVAAMQKDSLICKGLVPERAASVPEAERPAFLKAYRRTMAEFLQAQLELEIALLDGDEEAIKEAFRKVREMEDPSHDRFANEER